MIKKRQILIVVSVAVASFLFGTMFNFTTTVAEGSSSPWDRVWTAISELQNKVGSIEENLHQAKTIRFYEPKESYEDQSVWKDAAVFTWTPQNTTSNAILSIAYYLEYKVEGVSDYIFLDWGLRVGSRVGARWHGGLDNREYTWSGVFQAPLEPTDPLWVLPDQPYYTLAFQFRLYPGYQGTIYVKSVNIVIEVADGLQASN